MPELESTTSEDFDERIQDTRLVVVDFWADWCAPCHAMTPALEQFAVESAGEVVVLTADTVAHPDLAERFSIISLPTLLVFRSGELVHRTSGVKRLPQLRRMVAELLAS